MLKQRINLLISSLTKGKCQKKQQQKIGKETFMLISLGHKYVSAMLYKLQSLKIIIALYSVTFEI